MTTPDHEGPPPPSTVLFSKRLEFQNKIFHLDAIENRRGVAVRITEEVSASSSPRGTVKRTYVVVPAELVADLAEDLAAIAKELQKPRG